MKDAEVLAMQELTISCYDMISVLLACMHPAGTEMLLAKQCSLQKA
jgi:hypothetical protein